jgi:hypothetical protein
MQSHRGVEVYRRMHAAFEWLNEAQQRQYFERFDEYLRLGMTVVEGKRRNDSINVHVRDRLIQGARMLGV